MASIPSAPLLTPSEAAAIVGASSGLADKFGGAEAYRDISSSGFRGLVNQGATCYLNSLVQTLYMTPEIRYAVFNWRFDGTVKPHLSIAFQMQKLFAKLQTSSAAAISTEGLTTSFGWDRASVFTQQDVQEFIQKLYEMIEQTCKGTPLAKTWVELNHGTWRDYIECQKCKATRGKDEQFLNLSLEVKGFKSIEDSIADFVKPTVMEGGNAIMCTPCGSKQTSLKGYRFRSFPYLLALQLKRFDMNWNTMQRIKLENMVTFPSRLNLSSYLSHEESAGTGGDHEYECFSILMHTGNAVGGHYYSFTKDFVTCKWYEFNDSSVKELTERDMATVFSDLKSPDDTKDDIPSSTIIPAAPIVDEPAGAAPPPPPPFDAPALHDIPLPPDATIPPPPSSSSPLVESSSVPPPPPSAPADVPVLSSSVPLYNVPAPPPVAVVPASSYNVASNAYMLMYRRVDITRNLKSVAESSIPAEVKAEVDAENVQFHEAKAEFKRLANLIHFTIHCGPVASAADVEVKVSLPRELHLIDVIQEAANKIGISSRGVSMINLRLRSWDGARKKPTQPVVGNNTIDDYKFASYTEVYLEERDNGAEFEEYFGERLSLLIAEFDHKTTEFKGERPIDMLETQSLHDLRVAAAKMLGWRHDRIRLVMKLDKARADTATDLSGHRDNITLSMGLQLKNGDVIYVESCEEAPSTSSSSSLLMEKFQLLAFQISIQYNILGDKGSASYQGPTATMSEEEAKRALAAVKMGTIFIDERATLGQLKKELSIRLNALPVSEFRILKAAGGAELKDLSKQLSMYHMRDVGEVWLDHGRPMAPGDFSTRIHLQIPPLLQRRVHICITHHYQLITTDDGKKRHEWRVCANTRDTDIDGALTVYAHRIDWEFPPPLAGPLLIQTHGGTFDSSNTCDQRDVTTAGGIEITVTLHRHRLPPVPICHELTITSPMVKANYFFDMPLSSFATPSTPSSVASTTSDEAKVVSAPAIPVRHVLLPDQKDLFFELGDLIVNESWSYDELTRAISTLPGAPSANLMRLRECLNGQLSRFWLSTLPMKKNCPGLADGTEIYVQPLEAEEKLTADHLLLWIQQWCPAEMILTAPREVPLLKTMKISELKAFLAPKLGASFSVDDVLVVAPRPDERAAIERIPTLLWHNPRLRPIDTIAGAPWRARAGDFIFYMDKNSGRIASNIGSDTASRISLLNMSTPSGASGGIRSSPVVRREAQLTIFSPEQIEKRERDQKAMEDALRAELLAAGIDIGEAMAAAQQQESRSAAAASATSPSTAPVKPNDPSFIAASRVNEQFF